MIGSTIEVKSVEQYKQALEIRAEVFIKEQNVPADIEIDEYEEIAKHVLSYSEKGKPVATGRIRPYGNGAGKLERIAVLREARSGGYGRLVMTKLEQIGEQLGFHKFVLEAQVHAQGFYEKLGYVTVSDTPFYEAGILHVKMEKIK